MKEKILFEPNYELSLLNGKEDISMFVTEKTININNKKYRVINYIKDSLSDDLITTFGLLRSVVINENNNIVSFSPPKSIQLSKFIELEPEKKDYIIAEEFIEGTMVNLFWVWNEDMINGYWELTTKSIVSANSSFYKYNNNITFRDMFMETIKLLNFNLNHLNYNYSYSFVLQHPKNRIVVPFETPSLYLVAIYQIYNNVDGNTRIVSINMEEIREKCEWVLKGIKFPKIYKWNNYIDLINKYKLNTSYKEMGLVIHNLLNGTRTKIRNPTYEYVRRLRGNQPILQYQYLILRKEGNVKNFLHYYPEYKNEFSFFRDCLHNFTLNLYQNYKNCYIKRVKPLNEYPQNFRTHMFHIHKNYIEEMKPLNLYITYSYVIKFVNELHINLLMHSLNY
jgi:hypothetical protein